MATMSKKHPSRFWKKGRIRDILRNASYVGEWSFGKKKWKKDPETRRRRYRKQPEDQIKFDPRPHLRIIPKDLWEAVRVRREAVRENYAGKGDRAPGHPHQPSSLRRPLLRLLWSRPARGRGARRAPDGGCGHRFVRTGAVLRRRAVLAATRFGFAKTFFLKPPSAS